MEQSELLAYVVEVLDRLGLKYLITGFVATSYYGEPRFTNDIDILVELTSVDIPKFCHSFPNEDYYLSENAVREAIEEQKQFNIIHRATGLKVDLFISQETAFEQSRFNRGLNFDLPGGYTAWFASPEMSFSKK